MILRAYYFVHVFFVGFFSYINLDMLALIFLIIDYSMTVKSRRLLGELFIANILLFIH